MTEWMITIDTADRVASEEATLVAFAGALDEVRGTTGAAASINSRTGVLSATFSVEAVDVQRGVEQAVSLFNAALERVGIAHSSIAHVDAESTEEREPALT